MSKRKSKRHTILFIPAFIIALCGLLLFSQIGRCNQKTIGIVTSTGDKLEITYVIKTKTMTGTPTLYMGMLGNSDKYNLGDEVDVLYNARSHKNFVIKDENFPLLSYLLLGSGVCLFFIDNVFNNALPESYVFRLLNKEVPVKSKKEND